MGRVVAWPIVMRASLERGTLILADRDGLREQLRRRKDGELVVTIQRREQPRSVLQGRWYWSCILPALASYTGYDVDELHEYCKQRFNPRQVVITNRRGRIIGQSTTLLSKLTFGEYCEKIRRWAAADLGVIIPDPDPNYVSKRMREGKIPAKRRHVA
jgi:hypothetical protein